MKNTVDNQRLQDALNLTVSMMPPYTEWADALEDDQSWLIAEYRPDWGVIFGVSAEEDIQFWDSLDDAFIKHLQSFVAMERKKAELAQVEGFDRVVMDKWKHISLENKKRALDLIESYLKAGKDTFNHLPNSWPEGARAILECDKAGKGALIKLTNKVDSSIELTLGKNGVVGLYPQLDGTLEQVADAAMVLDWEEREDYLNWPENHARLFVETVDKDLPAMYGFEEQMAKQFGSLYYIQSVRDDIAEDFGLEQQSESFEMN